MSYSSVLEAAVKKVNMILLEAAELPNMNLDSITEEMGMSTCLPILMEAVCLLNMIYLFTYPGGRDGVTQYDRDPLGLLSAGGH